MNQGKALDFTAQFEASGEAFVIRPVEERDIESLRTWKNENRSAFFHKQTITPEQQAAWFAAFAARDGEQVFVLEQAHGPIACVGFRSSGDGVVDLFNLILGEVGLRGRGLMSAFYRCLEGQLVGRGVERIELKVLSDNTSAISFYRRNGFKVAEEEAECLRMEKRIG